MKKLNTLIKDTQIGRSGADDVPVGENKHNGTDKTPHGDGRDQVDAINQMFAEFELAYHNQFHKAYAREGSLAIAKKYWLGCLREYSPRVLLEATRKAVSSQEYLPTLSSIVRLCESGGELFGLPDVRAAYLQACMAPENKQDCEWSHPAVYLAGKATDWFVLSAEPESVSFPLFEYHYKQICRRVMTGEQLQVPSPPALSGERGRDLDAQENLTRLAELRKSLKL